MDSSRIRIHAISVAIYIGSTMHGQRRSKYLIPVYWRISVSSCITCTVHCALGRIFTTLYKKAASTTPKSWSPNLIMTLQTLKLPPFRACSKSDRPQQFVLQDGPDQAGYPFKKQPRLSLIMHRHCHPSPYSPLAYGDMV